MLIIIITNVTFTPILTNLLLFLIFFTFIIETNEPDISNIGNTDEKSLTTEINIYITKVYTKLTLTDTKRDNKTTKAAIGNAAGDNEELNI
jgi:regulatory protein YycH of two-component signal transduction system YycFG